MFSTAGWLVRGISCTAPPHARPLCTLFLVCRFLQQNRLSGQLPGAWGNNGSWPQLRYFYLDNNPLGGACTS